MNNYKHKLALISGISLLGLSSLAANAVPVWLSVEQPVLDALPQLSILKKAKVPVIAQQQAMLAGHQSPLALVQVDDSQLGLLADYIHQEKHRCGGFIAYPTLAEANQALSQAVVAATFTAPPLSQSAAVNSSLPLLNNANIAQFITDLSQYTNRYYTTSAGKNAADWIASQWSAFAAGKSYVQVSRVAHTGYAQQSVLLEITGSERPQEIVVLGGHLDSIVSGGVTESTRAPGADDDASGVATLSEIIKVLLQNGVRPKRTVRFYAYAAEEVGLRGSKDIATAAASRGDKVLAALQLDMTNYKGGLEDIVLMTDYTNASLNNYLVQLIQAYLPGINQSTDVCGYGCSDHATWHNAGFAATFPFEAKFATSNSKIHTVNDTLANADQSANHALKFAKLGLAYAIELANSLPADPTGTSGTEANLAATKGNWIYRTITVPSGRSSLSVNISGGSGDADLYVRLGSNPTTTQYQCRPYKTGNSESCVISTPTAGNWVVGIRAYSSFSGLTLNWQHQ